MGRAQFEQTVTLAPVPWYPVSEFCEEKAPMLRQDILALYWTDGRKIFVK